MKNIIILENKGRLANQLWLSANIYAFCLEKKYHYKNYSFYLYQKFFNQRTGLWFLDYFLAYLHGKLGKLLYKIFILIIITFNHKSVIKDHHQRVNLDLPSIAKEDLFSKKILEQIESNGTSFLLGWLFRYQHGLEKYKDEITKKFTPKEKYLKNIKKIINSAQSIGDILVGVHIRYGDYRIWQEGKYFFSFEEVKNILKNFLKSQKEPEKFVFLLCSDEPIDERYFQNFKHITCHGNSVEDLYTLAKCDLIIGSNSTFGSWAAYYGNIPFLRFSRETKEWIRVNK